MKENLVILPHGALLLSGKYRIGEQLGQGGFGITYRGTLFAKHKESLGAIPVNIPVAIKEFFFQDYCTRKENSQEISISTTKGKEIFDRFRQKLIKEAHILAQFDHPHIVKVLEVFEENNTVYMVMEYIEGESLRELLEENKQLPVGLALKYTRQVGEALIHIHGKRILHLDVKPSNVLISSAEDKAMLIDFGISKRYDENLHETSLTLAGKSKGYAPIEQSSGKGAAMFAPSLDVYSLGATLYHCLTGSVPPDSTDILQEGLTPPVELNKDIPESLNQAIIKAMALKKADRFQTMEEFLTALGKDQPVSQSEETQPEVPPVRPVIKSHPSYPGPTEHEVGSGGTTPPGDREKLVKKPDGRPNRKWIWWLVGSIILGALAVALWYATRGPSDREIEEKRIADSIRVADSMAMVQAEQQRIADSIAMAQAELAHLDSISQGLINPDGSPKLIREPKNRDESVSTYQTIHDIEMVYVEGGTFEMGSNDGDSDEKPVHTVTVDGFYIGKYEVTVSQYLQFAKETNSHYPEWLESGSVYNIYHGTDNHYKKFGSALTNENHPIIGISWHDAKAYCEWLSRKTGMKYRLPTEAQWEFAARGGNKSRGYIYSGSYTIGEVAWYTENSNGKTHPVGQKKANELGIYDMSGNVWEWCADWYAGDYYANSPRYNPENKTQTSRRVVRGGSWDGNPGLCRVAYRDGWYPDYRGSDVGFRLLRME